MALIPDRLVDGGADTDNHTAVHATLLAIRAPNEIAMLLILLSICMGWQYPQSAQMPAPTSIMCGASLRERAVKVQGQTPDKRDEMRTDEKAAATPRQYSPGSDKYWVHADDGLDIFAVHGIGGLIGNLRTGLFAADYIGHLDGYTVIPGGWLNRHWIQLAIQLCDSVVGMTYSFAVTLLILGTMSVIGRYIPAFVLRITPAEEKQGTDDIEMGEFAYDYVELTRNVKRLEPAHDVSQISEDEEVDAESQWSNSRAEVVRSLELQGGRGGAYGMHTLSRSPEMGDPYSHSGAIGTAA
ncbi:hypothetical protein LTR49_024559 [Elasticomyces elasticus]|nr:hypothetical protein LTR49_024559 [Elasticomyces elasticus]